MSRRYWYLLFAAAVLTWLFIGLSPQPIRVELTVVDQGSVESSIVEEARTRMRDTYILSAPFDGRLLRVRVEPGDAVKRGAAIANLTRSQSSLLDARSIAAARAAVETAAAQLRMATAARELAEQDYDRAERLAASGLFSQAALDTERTRLRSVQEQEMAARAELDRARSVLITPDQIDSGARAIALPAPIDGVVLEVLEKSETSIAAGTPIVMLGDPTQIDVVAEFLSQDAARLRIGDPAIIENWTDQAAALSARVAQIEPVAHTKVSALGIEEQRTRVVLHFNESIPQALRAHHYRVDARVITARESSAIRVPLGALFRDGDAWAVFVVDNHRARLRRVEPGIRDTRYSTIKSGLSVGEEIVLFPPRELNPGMRVSGTQRSNNAARRN